MTGIDQFASGAEKLQTLRTELDAIDGALLEAIRARLECCERIGRHKKAFGIAMMQPSRIGVVQARAAEFAEREGISPAFLEALYGLIIAETCRLEDLIIEGAKP